MLALLDEKELEGVLAHELTHVAHRDVAVITIASFLGMCAGLMMRFTLYSQAFGGRRDQNTALVFAAVAAVSAAVYAISFVLIRTLSRYRELAADRDGAILTGEPSALASALVKIDSTAARIPRKDLRSVQAFNAFFISPVRTSFSGWFSTHPSLEKRLDQLARISEDLGREG
jgi:heat shock protein HtpX